MANLDSLHRASQDAIAEARILNEHASRVRKLVEENISIIPNPAELFEHTRNQREAAQKLYGLSYRLAEQGQRLLQEQSASESCRYCGAPGAWIEGACVQCDVTLYAPASTPQEDGR